MNYTQKRWVRSIIRSIIRGEEFPEAGIQRVAAVLNRPGAEYMTYWWPKCGVLADLGVTCRGSAALLGAEMRGGTGLRDMEDVR